MLLFAHRITIGYIGSSDMGEGVRGGGGEGQLDMIEVLPGKTNYQTDRIDQQSNALSLPEVSLKFNKRCLDFGALLDDSINCCNCPG